MKGFLQRLARNRLAAIGGVLLAIIVLFVLLVPFLPLADPAATDTANKFIKPFSKGYWLGTDHLGRDLLSRLLWGTQMSLGIGIAAALLAAFLGSVIGICAGYFGGRVDGFTMRLVDMLMGFPYILLALAIVAALGPGLLNALIAVAVVNIPFFARNIRGITVGLAHREFVDAARLAGMRHHQIIWREIVPNVLPVIVVAMSTTIGWMILETAGLSFLGLGSQPPQADLGSMLGEARNAMITQPHTSLIPGLMIFLIVMSVNLLGDGIRDALDPRLRSGALSRPQAVTGIRRKADSIPATQDSQALLDLQNLETRFQVKGRLYRAVNQVNLTLQPGECVGIIGESGSGKSVTALSIMGLVASPPGIITGGAVRYRGNDVLAMSYEQIRSLRGKKVAYIFQDPLSTLHPLYRVGEQLLEAIRVHDKTLSSDEAELLAIHWLEQVRIPNARARMKVYPHELSGGMRQRVAIAMALINEPDIVIADEPTTALDVTVQAQILNVLNELRQRLQISIIFITHDFGVVAQLCDRIGVMYAGQLVEIGSTDAILSAPQHPYTRRLIACVPELGKGQGQLIAIPGLPPAIDNLPNGCAFAPRCDQAQTICQQGTVAQHEKHEHRVICHFPVGMPATGGANT